MMDLQRGLKIVTERSYCVTELISTKISRFFSLFDRIYLNYVPSPMTILCNKLILLLILKLFNHSIADTKIKMLFQSSHIHVHLKIKKQYLISFFQICLFGRTLLLNEMGGINFGTWKMQKVFELAWMLPNLYNVSSQGNNQIN